MTQDDRAFMRRAFELGERGRWHAAPNPRVGCVIAAQNEIWSEGWHHRVGERHAEVHALQRLPDRWRDRLSEATAYVTLEPCSHYGKTPPCAEALIEAGIGRVVMAISDPSPWVAGQGLQRLKEGGANAVLGIPIEAHWARVINRRFFGRSNRPWTVLKWAESSDGFIGPSDASASIAITSPSARRLTHRWRAEEAGILVGWRTWHVDRPRLDVRDAPGRSPERIVWAPHHERAAEEAVWWITQPDNVRASRDVAWEPSSGIVGLLEAVHSVIGVQSLLVEGGAQTLQSFIDADCWDECKWWVADAPLGQTGIASPTLPPVPTVWTETGRGAAEWWHRIIRVRDEG